MVLTFIAGFAATFGAAEGIRAAQSKSRREEHRTRKNNLVVRCARGSKYSGLLEGRRVVLASGKVSPPCLIAFRFLILPTHKLPLPLRLEIQAKRQRHRDSSNGPSSTSTPAQNTPSPSGTPSQATSSPTPPPPTQASSQPPTPTPPS